MKTIVVFLIFLLFIPLAIGNIERDKNDIIIREIIAKEILNELVIFINNNDFSKDYTHEYYIPLLRQMRDIVRNYNHNFIKKDKYKINKTVIEIRGNKDISRKPQMIRVLLIFENDVWILEIDIKQIKEGI